MGLEGRDNTVTSQLRNLVPTEIKDAPSFYQYSTRKKSWYCDNYP